MTRVMRTGKKRCVAQCQASLGMGDGRGFFHPQTFSIHIFFGFCTPGSFDWRNFHIFLLQKPSRQNTFLSFFDSHGMRCTVLSWYGPFWQYDLGVGLHNMIWRRHCLVGWRNKCSYYFNVYWKCPWVKVSNIIYMFFYMDFYMVFCFLFFLTGNENKWAIWFIFFEKLIWLNQDLRRFSEERRGNFNAWHDFWSFYRSESQNMWCTTPVKWTPAEVKLRRPGHFFWCVETIEMEKQNWKGCILMVKHEIQVYYLLTTTGIMITLVDEW